MFVKFKLSTVRKQVVQFCTFYCFWLQSACDSVPCQNKAGETLALPEFKNNACCDGMANELTNGTQSDRCVDLYKELDNTSKLSGTC